MMWLWSHKPFSQTSGNNSDVVTVGRLIHLYKHIKWCH